MSSSSRTRLANFLRSFLYRTLHVFLRMAITLRRKSNVKTKKRKSAANECCSV